MSNQNEQQNNQNDSGKVEKKYKNNVLSLSAIFNSETGKNFLAGKDKIPGSEVSSLVEELLGEELKSKREALKTELATLVKTKVDSDRAIAAEEKKLQQFKENKMKEFNTKAETIFKKVEGLDELRREYAQTLGEAAAPNDGAVTGSDEEVHTEG